MGLSVLLSATASSIALLVASVPGSAFAQSVRDYPTKPIRMIVPFPPGGSSDIIGRLIGQKLTDAWGQPVTIDSRPGAGGSLGTDIAAKAPPDGYTILVGNAAPISTNPLLIKVGYDSLRDFAPVSLVARAQQLLVVHPSMPVKTVQDLIKVARAYPGKIDYGSSGVGTIAHLATEMFLNMSGTKMTHIIYKGMPLVMNALVAGEVQVVFSDMAPAVVQVKAGKVRPIATTGAKRTPLLPDLPTVSEVLPGLNISNWWGLFVPAKTPSAIVGQLNEVVMKAVQSTDVRDRFAALGVEAVASTPAELAELVRAEMKAFGELIRVQKIRAE